MLERFQRAWRAFRHAPRLVGRRSFAGAQMGRLALELPGYSKSINSDLDGTLATLRARARNLCANHEYGRRFLSMVSVNLIGAYGPTLQVRATNLPANPRAQPVLDRPANGAVETHWARFGKTCDVSGRATLNQLLRVAVKAVARDGEALFRKVYDKRAPYGLRLQMLEADRLDESLNKLLMNGNMIRMGVEIDTTLRPVAYWLKTWHPGENYNGTSRIDTERVPADQIYHLYVPERAEQVRGYTWMHAVLMRSSMLQGYEEAAVVAARVGASKMGVYTATENGDTVPKTDLADEDASTGQLTMSAEPGEFIDLTAHPGVKLESWNPDYPHENFDSFVKACLRGIASGLDVDYCTLANDLEGVNYSSIRAGSIETREMWMTLQEWLIDSFLMPLYQDWLAAALPKGAITFPSGAALPAERLQKFTDSATFQGRRWDWVDPLKDAQASQALIDARLSSRRQIAAAQGRSIEDVIAELAEEEAMMEAVGLDPAPDKATKPNAQDAADAADLAAQDQQIKSRYITALERQAERPPAIVNVMPAAAPAVNVAPAQVRVEPMVVNVAPPVINNHIEPTPVTLEATIQPAEVTVRAEAPIVQVTPPDVVVNVAPKVTVEANLATRDSTTVHEYNNLGELNKSTTEYH
jgi:lambda family phage portal protein